MKQILLFITILLPLCLSAQLIEPFDGPEVTSANLWKGNVDKFRINEKGELQSALKQGRRDACIYIESSCLLENEWSCKVRIEQPATSQNYLKVFLWCEKPDMEVPGESLFVRLGYSDHNVALCYQLNNRKPEVLISGRSLFEEAAEVEIKVQIDAKGRCTLYSKSVTETDFYKEGTAFTSLTGGPGYFMLGTHCSVNQGKNKFFDDIYIREYTPRPGQTEEPPSAFQLIKLEQETATSLLLYFNREVSLGTDAYFFLSDIGEIEDIYIGEDEEDPEVHLKVLRLAWDQPLEKGKKYELIYYGVYDADMNENIEYRTFLSAYGNETPEPVEPDPETKASYGDVLINEIMSDPKGLTELPQTEYVELYNMTDLKQPLAGWSFVYGGKATLLSNRVLPPHGYIVLYRAGREVAVDDKSLTMALAKFPAQLANAGKDLQLLDAAGELIDEVVYEKSTPGKSWERSEEGWHLCSAPEGGTPGVKNSPAISEPEVPEEPEDPTDPETPVLSSVNPGEIIFNELLPNPYPGGSEYIELYNRTGRELSLKDLSVSTRKPDGSLSTKYPLSSVGAIRANGYVLLTKDKEGVRPWYLISSPENLYALGLPVLANGGSTLVLYRASDEVVIDEVAYSSQWHAASVHDEKGVALERIDPDKETQAGKNWTSASETAGYGTPGYRNSQDGTSDPNSVIGIEAPAFSESTGLYSIRYDLDQSGYNCRAGVYDLNGRQVVQVANHTLLGTSGLFTWDGRSSGGIPLKSGLYIFHATLYHPTGKTKEYKKVFLVR